MDPKELKKLQDKLKKEQEILNKALEALKKAQMILVDDQGQLKKDQETLQSAWEKLKNGQADLLEERQVFDKEVERLGPLSVIEPAASLKIDSKWLKDIVFKGKKEWEAKKKPGKKTKTRVFIPFERPMEAADVLSFRVDGNEVIIVTSDGQKFRVKK